MLASAQVMRLRQIPVIQQARRASLDYVSRRMAEHHPGRQRQQLFAPAAHAVQPPVEHVAFAFPAEQPAS